MKQNRFKSPVLWASIVAQVVSLLILMGVVDTNLGDTINAVAASVLQVLTLVGIFNDPTNASGI